MVSDVNRISSQERALHYYDFDPKGFEWIDCNDWEQSILGFIRKGPLDTERILVVLNFTPQPRSNYRIGVPLGGFWKEIFNSDAKDYGGSGIGNSGGVQTEEKAWHGHDQSLLVTVPPLATVLFKFKTEDCVIEDKEKAVEVTVVVDSKEETAE